jgi:ATP-binding protein involved in chromosome partitioning
MAGRVVTQLLKGTDWGELDVLILDLPPGTGDVQLAVCQDLQLSGAVAVTTPSKLALSDAQKGIEMFTSLGVPTLAAVENMSYFTVSFSNEEMAPPLPKTLSLVARTAV